MRFNWLRLELTPADLITVLKNRKQQETISVIISLTDIANLTEQPFVVKNEFWDVCVQRPRVGLSIKIDLFGQSISVLFFSKIDLYPFCMTCYVWGNQELHTLFVINSFVNLQWFNKWDSWWLIALFFRITSSQIYRKIFITLGC